MRSPRATIVRHDPAYLPAALDDIEAAVQQAASTMRQLRGLGRQTGMPPVRMDLRDAVAQTAKLLRRLLPATIAVPTSGDAGVFWPLALEGIESPADAPRASTPTGATVLVAEDNPLARSPPPEDVGPPLELIDAFLAKPFAPDALAAMIGDLVVGERPVRTHKLGPPAPPLAGGS